MDFFLARGVVRPLRTFPGYAFNFYFLFAVQAQMTASVSCFMFSYTESRFNYTTAALSPNGLTLLAVNEDGEIHLISLISRTVLHR